MRTILLGASFLALALAACGDDSSGAGGASSSTASTSSSMTTASTAASMTTSATGSPTTGTGMTGQFGLTSPELTEGADFSTVNTCANAADGNVSPKLDWANPPTGTMSYAVVFTDKTNNLIHWAIWDIPATSTGLQHAVENTFHPASESAASQALSYDNQTRGYLGPCPGEVHTYEFVVYALDVPTLTNLGMGTTRPQAEAEIKMHDLGSASLSGQGNPP